MKDLDRTAIVQCLRNAGAQFAFLHGSRAAGSAGPESDIDVAAHFGGRDPAAWEIDVPAGIDLAVLDEAALELAGRVALHGQLLFEDDPSARVGRQARTRILYFDEQLRQQRLGHVVGQERRHGR